MDYDGEQSSVVSACRGLWRPAWRSRDMHAFESCFGCKHVCRDSTCLGLCGAEGNVTWTDQQHLLDDEEQGYGLTRQQALIKFGKYLLHFRSDRKDRKARTISYRCSFPETDLAQQLCMMVCRCPPVMSPAAEPAHDTAVPAPAAMPCTRTAAGYASTCRTSRSSTRTLATAWSRTQRNSCLR